MILALAATLILAPPSRVDKPAALGPEPARPYVDIGPVAVPKKQRERGKLLAFLQLEGDRLGADGFFASDGGIDVYASGYTYPVGYSGRDELAAIFAIASAIVDATRRGETVIVRAYTFRDLPPATRAKLLEISAQVVTGEITLATFETSRQRLLAN